MPANSQRLTSGGISIYSCNQPFSGHRSAAMMVMADDVGSGCVFRFPACQDEKSLGNNIATRQIDVRVICACASTQNVTSSL